MAFSWKSSLQKWLSPLPKRWKEDLIRGFKMIQPVAASVSDGTLVEIELMQLRYRLERINRKLNDAYQTFGRRIMEHWDQSPVITEDEKKHLLHRINLLLKEQGKIVEQIQSIKEPPHPDNRAGSENKFQSGIST